MEPTTRLSVEAGMQDDSTTNSHNAFIKLNYILCCNERKGSTIFSVSSNAYTFGKIDEDRMYEKVRRENNIVTVRGGGGLVLQPQDSKMKRILIYIAILIMILPLGSMAKLLFWIRLLHDFIWRCNCA